MTLSCVLKVSKLDYRVEWPASPIPCAPHQRLYLHTSRNHAHSKTPNHPQPCPRQQLRWLFLLCAAAVDDHYFSWRRYICSAYQLAQAQWHLCVCPSHYTRRNLVQVWYDTI